MFALKGVHREGNEVRTHVGHIACAIGIYLAKGGKWRITKEFKTGQKLRCLIEMTVTTVPQRMTPSDFYRLWRK